MLKMGVAISGALAILAGGVARAEEPMQAIGAQRCAGQATTYTVEFLAPESTGLLALATVTDGTGKESRGMPSLSLDGKECGNAQCDFRARKGQSYTIAAARKPGSVGKLCVSVVRP